jgi:hypothetical protein
MKLGARRGQKPPSVDEIEQALVCVRVFFLMVQLLFLDNLTSTARFCPRDVVSSHKLIQCVCSFQWNLAGQVRVTSHKQSIFCSNNVLFSQSSANHWNFKALTKFFIG